MIDAITRRRPHSVSTTPGLRWATVVFVIALGVHAGDHYRRGMGTLGAGVTVLGTIQQVAAVATIVLVFMHHRWAAGAAIGVGFASAVGFTMVHLMPKWFGTFSDSFIDAPASARVTGFSWFAAIFEITAALGIAIAGLLARDRRPL